MPGAPFAPAPETRQSRFSVRPSRLRWPEWVVGISAVVMLVALFGMNWFTVGSGGLPQTSYSLNGWHGLSHGRWLLLITILAGLALFVLQATRPTPTLPSTMSVVVLILGLLATIWLVVRVIIDPPAGRDAGGWVALASAIALTLGGWRSLATEGIAPEDAPADIPLVTSAELAAGRSGAIAERSAPADRS